MYSTHTSLFLRSKNASPLASRGIYLLVLRSKMRLPLQEQRYLPPCFYEVKCDCPCRSRRFYLLVLRSKMRYYFNVSAFALTSSIVPTLKNAASGYSSISPSSIALKPLTVSSTGTYLPGVPVKFSATWNG